MKLGRYLREFFTAPWRGPRESVEDWERREAEARQIERNDASDGLQDRRAANKRSQSH